MCEWFVEVMVSFTMAMASRQGGAAADGWRLE